ncbi:hypothetical protein RUND412_001566 [Rhizina undulata]
MASNVVVLYGQRRATIKTTPGKLLSEVRTEACTKFGLDYHSFTLKRNSNTLDLSLSIRLLNLPPGAKLELLRSKTSGPINVVLRTVEEPITELAGTFPSTTTIWSILRKFESKARAEGKNNATLTERGEPSGSSGAGRLVYLMPSVRVDTGRELASFAELGQTLSALGHSGGRVLMKIRFLKTGTPYEEALAGIAGFSKDEEEDLLLPEAEESAGVMGADEKKENVEMVDPPASESSTPNPVTPTPEETVGKNTGGPETLENTQHTDGEPLSNPESSRPSVTVYRPSNSSIPAAAQIDVPEQAYEVGINEARRHQSNLAKAARGTRLLSDREKEEKETAIRDHDEKIKNIQIKVRFPDGYSCVHNLQGRDTAADLYNSVRNSLRYPNEPFTLTIPPREQIPDDSTRRLTTNLRLGNGATVQFAWAKEVSNKARKEKYLNDEMLRLQQALPETKVPEMEVVEEEKEKKDKGVKVGKGEGSSGNGKGKESLLRGFLRLGKK